jgi:hypothetical protein
MCGRGGLADLEKLPGRAPPLTTSGPTRSVEDVLKELGNTQKVRPWI